MALQGFRSARIFAINPRMPKRAIEQMQESIRKNNEMLKRLHDRIEDLESHLKATGEQQREPNPKHATEKETGGSGARG